MKQLTEYSITYLKSGINQRKILIPHEEYLRISEMEIEVRDSALKKLTGGKEWFTDKSPLYEAIESGVLDCNGLYPVKLEELREQIK